MLGWIGCERIFSEQAEKLRRGKPYLVGIFALCAVGVLTGKGPADPQLCRLYAWWGHCWETRKYFKYFLHILNASGRLLDSYFFFSNFGRHTLPCWNKIHDPWVSKIEMLLLQTWGWRFLLKGELMCGLELIFTLLFFWNWQPKFFQPLKARISH